MVVRLRLQRWGQRNRPFYRIVAAYSKSKRDGRHLEVVGAYNPLPASAREAKAHIKRVYLDIERIKFWLATGATPSDTVARLLGTSGLLPISPRTVRKTSLAPPGANKNNDSVDGDRIKSATMRGFSTTTSPQSNISHGLQGLLKISKMHGISDRTALLR